MKVFCITQTPARSTGQCNSLCCDSQCDTGNICSGPNSSMLCIFKSTSPSDCKCTQGLNWCKSSINVWYLKWKTCLLTFFQAFLSQGHIKKSPFEYMHGFTFYIVTEVLYRIYLFCDTLVSTEFCETGVSTCFQIRYLKRTIFYIQFSRLMQHKMLLVRGIWAKDQYNTYPKLLFLCGTKPLSQLSPNSHLLTGNQTTK